MIFAFFSIFQNCDTVRTVDTVDTAHTVDTVGIANTVDTVGTLDTVDTVDTIVFLGKFDRLSDVCAYWLAVFFVLFFIVISLQSKVCVFLLSLKRFCFGRFLCVQGCGGSCRRQWKSNTRIVQLLRLF